MAVGHDSEGSRKDGSNGEGPGNNVQGGGALSVTIWKIDLGGDREYAQCPEGVSLSVGVTDHRDDSETLGRRRVRVSSSRGGNVLRWAPPNRIIHQETEDDHIGEGGLPEDLYTLHGGGEDDRDKPESALVGPRRGT